jgi:serine/threonine-protein kinase RsbW
VLCEVADAGWQRSSVHTSEEALDFLEHLKADLALFHYQPRDRFAVELALAEALVNALQHGNKGDCQKEVRCRYRIDATEVTAEIEDEGPGFDPNGVPDPTLPGNVERPHGRGLALIRGFMTRVSFNARGNRIRMSRLRTG